MNIFTKQNIAEAYDAYYQTEFGKKVDQIEKQMVSSLLQQLRCRTILELGCGTGHWTEYFIQQGFQVTGIDNAQSMLSIAKTKNLPTDFICADAEDLPFAPKSQSMVASITMLEFVDHPKLVAAEIDRILQPGGWLLLGSLNKRSALGENQEQDEVFRHANLFELEQIPKYFSTFTQIAQQCGIHLNNQYEILDGSPATSDVEPVFIATLFQKT
jgi:ubiquinone/menaquinone biosynthesis C-methylase UbiE